MGYNTSIMIFNDCLNDISNDPDFGRNLANAISGLRPNHDGIKVRAGSCGHAATAIETHHSTSTAIVSIGGNRGEVIDYIYKDTHDEDKEIQLLKALASKHGYELIK